MKCKTIQWKHKYSLANWVCTLVTMYHRTIWCTIYCLAIAVASYYNTCVLAYGIRTLPPYRLDRAVTPLLGTSYDSQLATKSAKMQLVLKKAAYLIQKDDSNPVMKLIVLHAHLTLYNYICTLI